VCSLMCASLVMHAMICASVTVRIFSEHAIEKSGCF
jgi:hypothetical protein